MSLPPCVILAGGLATRLGPRSASVPKWLVPVADRPFAAWQLDRLAAEGVTSVVCCIGHLGDQIVEQVGDGAAFGIHVSYSRDGEAPKGTAGALRQARDRGLLETPFLLLYGDSFLPIRLAPVWEAYERSGRPALMTVFRNDDAYDRSNVAYADGRVLRYAKDVATGAATGDGLVLDHIDYGLSCLDPALLDAVDPEVASDLAPLLSAAAAEGRLAGFEVHERFYEIGSPAGLDELDALLRSGRDGSA